MDVQLREVRGAALEEIVPLLLLAEPSEPSLRWSLNHMADTVYRADAGDLLVGAATLRWGDDPAEILELAVAAEYQGRGLGRQIILWLAEEGRRRGKRQLVVGTGNSSLGNIAFYQRCGMRMDHVRRDYFRYERRPLVENGIERRDLLVFRLDLGTGKR